MFDYNNQLFIFSTFHCNHKFLNCTFLSTMIICWYCSMVSSDYFYLTLLENKKAMEHEGGGDTNCNWCTWKDSQRFGRGGNWRTSQDHPNVVEVGQNNDKSPGKLRLSISLTPLKDHHQTLVVIWLVVWVLWHIKLSRSSNAKYIFMQIVSSISNNSV